MLPMLRPSLSPSSPGHPPRTSPGSAELSFPPTLMAGGAYAQSPFMLGGGSFAGSALSTL